MHILYFSKTSTFICLVGAALLCTIHLTGHTQPHSLPTHRLSIGISTQKTTLLVFPVPVDMADMGSADILVRPMQKGSNILKVKAARASFTATNLSVLTKDGHLFSIDVVFDSLSPQQVYYYGEAALPDSIGVDSERRLNPIELQETALQAAAQPAGFGRVQRQYRMLLQLRNVLYRNDLLFFVFHIRNGSRIPYDIHFIRSYQHDRHRTKRSSQTEQELQPVWQYVSSGERIKGKSTATVVLVFDKFTMADHKKLTLELYEKKGDRILRMHISGTALLKAATW